MYDDQYELDHGVCPSGGWVESALGWGLARRVDPTVRWMQPKERVVEVHHLLPPHSHTLPHSNQPDTTFFAPCVLLNADQSLHLNMAQAQPLQSISIPRYESRSNYVVYAILVKLPVRSWTVYRRYSEFVALEKSLSGLHGANRPPPKRLPPKDTAREWKKTFSGFLGRTSASVAGAATGSANGDDELFLKERRQGLEDFLKAIVMDESNEWRETDMFKSFIEWPQSLRMTTSVQPPSNEPKTSSTVTAQSLSQRTTASSKAMPGALPASRTLGQTPPPKPKAQETDFTRPLGNASLLQSQTDEMDQQDQQLLNLASILRRQRQMGEAINQELVEQTELLGQLDTEVEATQGKMDQAERKMDRFDGGKARRKIVGGGTR